ncbi:hypothetical protein BVI434_770003 [Burkholderia vietnamiensis]|nr:hypothetical protein BVI434_770003 [Burkholderia vietnamiensis]
MDRYRTLLARSVRASLPASDESVRWRDLGAAERFWRSTGAVYCLTWNHQSVKTRFAVTLRWTIVT